MQISRDKNGGVMSIFTRSSSLLSLEIRKNLPVEGGGRGRRNHLERASKTCNILNRYNVINYLLYQIVLYHRHDRRRRILFKILFWMAFKTRIIIIVCLENDFLRCSRGYVYIVVNVCVRDYIIQYNYIVRFYNELKYIHIVFTPRSIIIHFS